MAQGWRKGGASAAGISLPLNQKKAPPGLPVREIHDAKPFCSTLLTGSARNPCTGVVRAGRLVES